MKITYNINLDGRVFTIDEDAYRLLNDYIETLKHVFSDTENKEVTTDIEARISEIFYMEKESGKQVVTLSDVENVITRIGHPNELASEIEIKTDSESITVEEISESNSVPPPFPLSEDKKPVKRLFRDSKNGMMGGVCAGIAEYLNIDVTWVRLFVVLLCFFSFSTLALVYLILWIILPNADTPLQRMQLTGESPTLQNIGQSVKQYFRNDNSYKTNPYGNEDTIKNKSCGKRFFDGLANFFGIVFKIFLILSLIVCIPVIIALALGLIGCFIALIAVIVAGVSFISIPGFEGMDTPMLMVCILCAIGLIITIGIPIYALIRLIIKGERSEVKPANKIAFIITWVMALVLFIVTAVIITVNIDNSSALVLNQPWW
ncbi:MAG: PspC domain-containing protein [Muribaculaceae bacterium]|nr:PspC domain-containing protein [Muribaculaceae bacterium]